ncbi:FmdE family protein [Calderihabitans maritimus]|uniref:Formylmethanofuran dehydrogenase subunit E n=1 Tax=Calderihabitans maritimus TaxID=1246530 RepID=A0A1Z5HUP6_9FIRM|nr:FmdE family protein [Calderihabitans maritimus]GAW93051.1 formylmethanofuran dehydrogenase subunit E [Calderihabitans maritimus]
MEIKNANWDKAISFHGHACPGLAIGYRASMLALEKLGVKRSSDEELVAIVENNSCSVDAIQVILGCSFGKGNLLFRDFGKQVFIIGNRNGEQALRVALRYGALRGGSREARIEYILEAPEEQLFNISWVEERLPQPARIYPTVQCSVCGEGVMEPRARLRESKVICIPCLKQQS